MFVCGSWVLVCFFWCRSSRTCHKRVFVFGHGNSIASHAGFAHGDDNLRLLHFGTVDERSRSQALVNVCNEWCNELCLAWYITWRVSGVTNRCTMRNSIDAVARGCLIRGQEPISNLISKEHFSRTCSICLAIARGESSPKALDVDPNQSSVEVSHESVRFRMFIECFAKCGHGVVFSK